MLIVFQTNAQKDIDSCYIIYYNVQDEPEKVIVKQKRPKIALSQGDAQFFYFRIFSRINKKTAIIF